MPSWISQLQKLLGASKVSTRPDTLETHSRDMWFASHKPEAIVFARTTRDVSETLRFASRRKIPVTARGAGKGYVGGCVPEREGIVLSLARMSRIVKLSQKDSIAIVQPGVITATLQNQAREKGLYYPPDPASLKESTIGGNIATNAGGPRCVKYGVTGNFVLGTEVVLADGTIVRTGGTTIKNKTGFNLTQLFVGSEGMLGIVTEATLRLIPCPPDRALLVGAFPTARQAASCIREALRSGLLPSALEVADPFTLKAARDHLGNVPRGDALVFLETDGLPEAVKAQAAHARRIFQKTGATSIRSARGEEACEKLWEVRRGLSASLKASGLRKLNEDIVVPLGRLLDVFALAEKLQKKHGFPVACFGHAGDGNIHVNIMVPPDMPHDAPEGQRALDDLFGQVLRWKGSITGEHGVGLAKKRWWEQATSAELRALHQSVKQALDPSGLLNPGKFLDE